MNSFGLALLKGIDGDMSLLIAHMGGPFWENKHEHAWSIPKGMSEEGETDTLVVAEREFEEEMGSPAPTGESIDLGTVKSGKKTIGIFARLGEFVIDTFSSNHFEMEWPKGSGRMQSFPPHAE